MNTEIDILLNLYNDMIVNIQHIKNSKERITNIKNDMKKLNNNYFSSNCNDELYNQYFNMFDDDDLYNEVLNNLEYLKTQKQMQSNLLMLKHTPFNHESLPY